MRVLDFMATSPEVVAMKMSKIHSSRFEPDQFLEQYGSPDVESARWSSGVVCAKCRNTPHSSYCRGLNVKVFK